MSATRGLHGTVLGSRNHATFWIGRRNDDWRRDVDVAEAPAGDLISMSTVEIVSAEADLFALAADWNRLADRNGNPLRRFEWFRASSDALNAGDRLRVLVFR